MKRILFLHEHNSPLQPSMGRNYNRRSRFQTLEEVFRMLYKVDSAACVKKKDAVSTFWIQHLRYCKDARRRLYAAALHHSRNVCYLIRSSDAIMCSGDRMASSFSLESNLCSSTRS